MFAAYFRVDVADLASFWKTNATYTAELRDLQARGYTGDGFFSAGRLVRGGKVVEGDGVSGDGASWRTAWPPLTALAVDQAFVCGGAQQKKNGYSRSTHRRREYGGSSTGGKSRAEPSHRGPLKGKGPKAGSRIKRAFAGDGHALSNDPTQSKFRKRAVSKNAYVAQNRERADYRRSEERAAAAERRLRHERRRAEGLPSDTEESEDEDELDSDEDEVRQTSDAEQDQALDELQNALDRYDGEDLNLISSDDEVVDRAPAKSKGKGKAPLKRTPTFSAFAIAVSATNDCSARRLGFQRRRGAQAPGGRAAKLQARGQRQGQRQGQGGPALAQDAGCVRIQAGQGQAAARRVELQGHVELQRQRRLCSARADVRVDQPSRAAQGQGQAVRAGSSQGQGRRRRPSTRRRRRGQRRQRYRLPRLVAGA